MSTEGQFQHFQAQITEGRVSQAIEGGYNRIRDQFIGETRDGFFAVMGSGFGKGALAAAAAIVAGAAFVMGGLALAGALSVIPGGAPVGVGTAILGGAGMGVSLLFTPLGAGTVLGVGAVNGFNEWRHQKNEVEMLKAIAAARVAKREQEEAKAKQPQPEVKKSGPDTPPPPAPPGAPSMPPNDMGPNPQMGEMQSVSPEREQEIRARVRAPKRGEGFTASVVEQMNCAPGGRGMEGVA